MAQFLSGAVFLAGLAASFFFFRSWKRTRDRFFLFFATAFGLLAIERVLLEVLRLPNEAHHQVYLTRLLAFSLILIAIADKNRQSQRTR